MGAAKNARKARRKARRSEDRVTYYVDIETYRTHNSQFGSAAGSVFGYAARSNNAAVVIGIDRNGHKFEKEYQLDLTSEQRAALQQEGIELRREPTPDPKPILGAFFDSDFFKAYREGIDKGRFDARTFADIYLQQPVVAPTTGIDPRAGTLASADLSALELRALAQMMPVKSDKEFIKTLSYMKAYGVKVADLKKFAQDYLNGGPDFLGRPQAGYGVAGPSQGRGGRVNAIFMDDPYDDYMADLHKPRYLTTMNPGIVTHRALPRMISKDIT